MPFIGGYDYLFCDYKLDPPMKYDKKIKYRDFRNCNHVALKDELNEKLRLTNTNKNIGDANLSYLIKSVTSSLDNFAPLTERKLSRPKNRRLTNALKQEFRERDALYKRAHRTGDRELLVLYMSKKKDLKNKLNAARNDYFKQILENSSHQSSIWTNLKRMAITELKKSSPLDHFYANDLNDSYANILKKHPSCSKDFFIVIPAHATRKVNNLFNWTQIDNVGVTKNLQLTLRKSKGKSPDVLDLKWLRDHLSQISIFLMTIFNRSLDTGIFPDVWKSVFQDQ